jgi:hypothetical protein
MVLSGTTCDGDACGWIDRHQQAVIAYQKEEIKVLREMLGGKRLRFTDGQRRRLALKAQALSTLCVEEPGSSRHP